LLAPVPLLLLLRRWLQSVRGFGSLVWHAPPMEPVDTTAFVCPRCEQPASEDFYGPCTQCREALGALFQGEAREVANEAYEPKMNVTPNAVALKD